MAAPVTRHSVETSLRAFPLLFSLLIFGVFAFPAFAGSIPPDDPDFLELQLGSFDIRHAHTFAFDLEYRSDYKIFDVVKPMVGVLSTARGAVFGYGGFAVDFYLGQRFVLTPSLAIGAYSRGNDVDLGTAAPEFRSAFEIAYRFDDRSRLGVEFHHISNAGTAKRNPGAETLLLTYAYPFSKLRDQIIGQ